MALHGGAEDRVGGGGAETSDLAAPAVADDGPLGEGARVVGRADDTGDLVQGLGGHRLGGEEGGEVLRLLGGRGWVPGDVGGAALEEVGHEHAVFACAGGGQNVGTLESMGEEAEDIC